MTTTELETFFGTPNKAADFFGVSPEAFYQWRKRPGSLILKVVLLKLHIVPMESSFFVLSFMRRLIHIKHE